MLAKHNCCIHLRMGNNKSDVNERYTFTSLHKNCVNDNAFYGQHFCHILFQFPLLFEQEFIKFLVFSFFFFQPNDIHSSPKELKKFNEVNRKFNGAKDASRDFTNSQENGDRGSISDQAFACSASSVESLPSASGSSKLFVRFFALRLSKKMLESKFFTKIIQFNFKNNRHTSACASR